MIYEDLLDFLDQVTSLELRRLPCKDSNTIHGSIVYMPQIGYLMCLFGTKLDEHALENLQDFEFAFAGGEGHEEEFFYRTSKTKELDFVLGDIYHKILDMERAILMDLKLRIQPFSMNLRKAANFVAELDWHVLQEMTVETFVPNDTNFTSEGWISIITGPNYSGKSVYIKQVALIVFLSHIGSFVPADSAIVGITDRIFCGVASKHTITSEQSTFMMDLHQIGFMLRHATSRSLCLIDEFGKGTLTTDGIGLLCASLKHFASYENPPKVLVCTHLSQIFNENHLPKSKSLGFYTMSILKTSNNIRRGMEDIIFLYRLVPGHAFSSYGLHCAELAGVPHEILERASYIMSMTKDGKPIVRLCNESLSAKDQQYKDLAEKLVAFDFINGDVEAFLKDTFTCKL